MRNARSRGREKLFALNLTASRYENAISTSGKAEGLRRNARRAPDNDAAQFHENACRTQRGCHARDAIARGQEGCDRGDCIPQRSRTAIGNGARMLKSFDEFSRVAAE